MGPQQGRPIIGPDPTKLLLKRACEDEGSGYHLTVKKMLEKQPQLLNAVRDLLTVCIICLTTSNYV